MITSCLEKTKIGDSIVVCYDFNGHTKIRSLIKTGFNKTFTILNKKIFYYRGIQRSLPLLESNDRDDLFNADPYGVGTKKYWLCPIPENIFIEKIIKR